MPLYEYQCASCRKSFEALRSMRDANNPIVCPQCGEYTTERKISMCAAVSKDSSGSHLITSSQGSSGGCGSCSGGSCATCGH